jgi:predicted nucleic acid-binding protein
MTEREFFDTNILLYANIDDGSQKHTATLALVKDRIVYGEPYISVQVLNEFIANAKRKGRTFPEIRTFIEELIRRMFVIPLKKSNSRAALVIAERYQLSFWDSLIITSALEMNCSVLYTEDLQHGQIIEGILRIHNPFVQFPMIRGSSQ